MRDVRSNTIARVWLAGDGRVHRESERPPRSVRGELGRMAWFVADARGMTGPTPWSVPAIVAWLDGQLDWISRQSGVVEFGAIVREIVTQLRPMTGERGPAYVGKCPNPVEHDDEVRSCGARLHAPHRGDAISCRSCRRTWPREEWLHLGRTMQVAS